MVVCFNLTGYKEGTRRQRNQLTSSFLEGRYLLWKGTHHEEIYFFFFREEGEIRKYTSYKIPKSFSFFKTLILLTKKKSPEIYHLINQDTTIHLFFRNWSEFSHKVDSSHSWYDFDKSFTIFPTHSTILSIYWCQFSEGSCFKKYIVQSYVKTLFFWFWDGQIFYKTKTHKMPSILQL